MHIVFLNPQGNFDRNDSYWTMHPDFGGQLVYVKEIAINLQLDASNVVRSLDALRFKKWVKKIQYGNKQKIYYNISKSGKKLLPKAVEIYEEDKVQKSKLKRQLNTTRELLTQSQTD